MSFLVGLAKKHFCRLMASGEVQEWAKAGGEKPEEVPLKEVQA